MALLVPATQLIAASGTACEQLKDLVIPTVTVRSATQVPAGPFRAPGARADVVLPEFCRVAAVARPVPDSEIEFEVWMPAANNWNGKFQGVGNGGYSGSISYPAMIRALQAGYATASHNTGHNGDDLKFGLGHPEKVIDYAYRAVHVMTEHSKVIVRVHLGRFADKSYFTGCSAGGHQAVSEAMRYPADYDGILAGAPAINRIGQTLGFISSWQALHRADGSLVVPNEKLAAVTKAVIEACDAVDGLKDGLIDDPRRCGPTNLDKILNPEEAEAIRKVWAGTKSPRTGERIFPGWPVGSEDLGDQGWRGYLTNPKEPMRVEVFRYFLFGDLRWDFRSLDWDRDRAYFAAKLGFLNATDPNLNAFRAAGGKLLIYTGWEDPVVSPLDTVDYFDKVTQASGGPAKTKEFARLFMVPGMGHCAGGIGPNQFDALSALDEWVTKGKGPEKIIAKRGERTRPLCPYPQVARYKGAGSIDDAANFTCGAAR